jgi:hypothetical protein
MTCYSHAESPAVCICAYCGRALCRTCATTIDGKLSCRGDCEFQIARERRLIAHSEATLNQNRRALIATGVVCLLLGLLLAFFGVAVVTLGLWYVALAYYVEGAAQISLGVLLLGIAYGIARFGNKLKSLSILGPNESP